MSERYFRLGQLAFPAFLPDATLGVVHALEATDLIRCGVQAVIMNTFHLMQSPGSSTIAALGGLHQMANWPRPIFTDSGGFQAYSLIRQNPQYGRLTDKGILFRPPQAERKFQLTPEKAIQLQMAYGADLLFCLDDCTHVDDSAEVQTVAVQRTIAWAKKGKAEFQRLVEQKRLSEDSRPLLFAVIQGGGSRDLRRECAQALLEIGFDGFGFGGWPMDKDGQLLTDILFFTREQIPTQYAMHALGIGHPQSLVTCVKMGYDLFDCSMPTKDARKGRLYVFSDAHSTQGEWFSYLYVEDKKHIKSNKPLSGFCDCLCCAQYSLGYLRHLHQIGDTVYQRLATIHNLRFMNLLMERLRK